MERVELVLAEARAVGIQIRAETDRLVILGRPEHEPLARQLLEQKPAVLAYLEHEDAEVAWRAAAMRPQVMTRGPIPVLVARDTPYREARCVSCGDPLAEDARFRCRPCSRAARLVLYEVREGLVPKN